MRIIRIRVKRIGETRRQKLPRETVRYNYTRDTLLRQRDKQQSTIPYRAPLQNLLLWLVTAAAKHAVVIRGYERINNN